MNKLFLDDLRNAPDSSWDVVRSYDAFVKYIEDNGVPDIISFDHDLADEHYLDAMKLSPIPYSAYKEKTGYGCAKWLVENGYRPNEWQVHSYNPVGKKNIIALLSNPRNYKNISDEGATALEEQEWRNEK